MMEEGFLTFLYFNVIAVEVLNYPNVVVEDVLVIGIICLVYRLLVQGLVKTIQFSIDSHSSSKQIKRAEGYRQGGW